MLHKTKVRETDPSAVVGIFVQKWVYLALSWKYTKLSTSTDITKHCILL